MSVRGPCLTEALVQQGIYELDDGARVFAGQRDDPFYIDLGAIFDTLNLRNPGVDMLSGFNVHSIALELPASWLTEDEQGPDETGSPVLGAYASTYRRLQPSCVKRITMTTRKCLTLPANRVKSAGGARESGYRCNVSPILL